MRLANLNPDAHKRWMAQFGNGQNRDVDALNEQTRKGQDQRARTASKNGFAGRI